MQPLDEVFGSLPAFGAIDFLAVLAMLALVGLICFLGTCIGDASVREDRRLRRVKSRIAARRGASP